MDSSFDLFACLGNSVGLLRCDSTDFIISTGCCLLDYSKRVDEVWPGGDRSSRERKVFDGTKCVDTVENIVWEFKLTETVFFETLGLDGDSDFVTVGSFDE